MELGAERILVTHGEPVMSDGTAALRRAFEAAGLDAVGQRCQSNLPYRQVAPRLLNRCLPVYNALDWIWEYSGAARWFGTFVVTWGRVAGERSAMSG